MKFKGQAIISDESAETVGKVIPGIPKNFSTIGADQSAILKVVNAIVTEAPTANKKLFVTK